MPWDRLQWGIAFRGSDGHVMLIGETWALPAGAPCPLPDSPTRALMFTTRDKARQWCAIRNAEWAASASDIVCRWRVKPVRVRETVQPIRALT